VLKHSFTDQVSAIIEFDGGMDATINNGTYFIDPAIPTISIFDVQEAYATWATPVGLTFTAGKFVTYEGIEVVEGPINPTITRGFLFGLAEPIYHVGAKLHYAIGEVADLGVGVANGWDTMIDNNDAKTFIFRVGITPVDEFWAGISGTYGAERTDSNDDRRLSLDLTGGVQAGDMVTINFQANYGSEPDAVTIVDDTGAVISTDDGSWFGFGLQPVLTVDAFSLGLRFEYFADNNGGRTGNLGTDTNVWNLTLTPGYTIDEALQLRAEYRFDSANERIFGTDDPATADNEVEDSQHTIALAVAYMF
jgi:hypothetical protein